MADLDRRPIGSEGVRVSVETDTDASVGSLDHLTKRDTLWSPVVDVLRDAVHLDVSLAPSGLEKVA